jgi:hypothetical protein
VATVRVLFRAELRHRWRSWLLLTLLVALVSGLVLAGVAAGRRTETAYPRYVADHGYDTLLYSSEPMPTIADLPDVTLVVGANLLSIGPPLVAARSGPSSLLRTE